MVFRLRVVRTRNVTIYDAAPPLRPSVKLLIPAYPDSAAGMRPAPAVTSEQWGAARPKVPSGPADAGDAAESISPSVASGGAPRCQSRCPLKPTGGYR